VNWSRVVGVDFCVLECREVWHLQLRLGGNMSVPDFQSMMFPLLEIFSDQKEHSIQETAEFLAKKYKLTDEELNELLPSGKQTRFQNRVGWSRTYLAKAKLIQPTRRSYYQITARGQEVLKSKVSRIDMKYLEQFPEYITFKEKESTPKLPKSSRQVEQDKTPEEVLEDAYDQIRESLAESILENVLRSSPSFFERLVVELLVNMGYGGSRKDAAKAVGQSGDEGIDGIIDEDRLGLDTIYIQAKKWKVEQGVGRPEIQKFVGALAGKRAKKGIFITTSHFSNDALKYANEIDTKVILVDGQKLAEFMIDYGVGVTEVTSYNLKKIDYDYFENA
jgi:restriction system protein